MAMKKSKTTKKKVVKENIVVEAENITLSDKKLCHACGKEIKNKYLLSNNNRFYCELSCLSTRTGVDE